MFRKLFAQFFVLATLAIAFFPQFGPFSPNEKVNNFSFEKCNVQLIEGPATLLEEKNVTVVKYPGSDCQGWFLNVWYATGHTRNYPLQSQNWSVDMLKEGVNGQAHWGIGNLAVPDRD